MHPCCLTKTDWTLSYITGSTKFSVIKQSMAFREVHSTSLKPPIGGFRNLASRLVYLRDISKTSMKSFQFFRNPFLWLVHELNRVWLPLIDCCGHYGTFEVKLPMLLTSLSARYLKIFRYNLFIFQGSLLLVLLRTDLHLVTFHLFIFVICGLESVCWSRLTCLQDISKTIQWNCFKFSRILSYGTPKNF